jgi:chorismate mutase
MSDESQMRALKNFRERLSRRGMARFEVLALDQDRELIRSLARRLAANGAEAAEIRASLHRGMAAEKRQKGGVLAALRRSPLVGANLNVARPVIDGRKVDL